MQFSVRDLLFLVLACSMIAAWFGSALAEGRREWRVLAEITRVWEAAGNNSMSAHESAEWKPGGTTWIRRLVGDQWLSWLDRVRGLRCDGAELKFAAQLTHVEVLGVYGSVTSEDVAYLTALSKLQALDLCMAGFSRGADDDDYDDEPDGNGAVFHRIGEIQTLRGLNLYGTSVSNKDLSQISRLGQLEVLDLSDTDISDRRISELLNLPKLRFLSLAGTPITDAAIPAIAQLTRLEDLNLRGTEISAEGVLQLRSLVRLKALGYPEVAPDVEKQIQQAFPQLDWEPLRSL